MNYELIFMSYWKKITTFKIKSGQIVEQSEFEYPNELTTNQADWRKSWSLSFKLEPPPNSSSDVCINDYRANTAVNINRNRLFYIENLDHNSVKQMDIRVAAAIAQLTKQDNGCLASSPPRYKKVKIYSLQDPDLNSQIIGIAVYVG